MEQKDTQRNNRIRIAAELEPALVELIDAERQGRCSRATIVRMALHDRYKKPAPRSRREVA